MDRIRDLIPRNSSSRHAIMESTTLTTAYAHLVHACVELHNKQPHTLCTWYTAIDNTLYVMDSWELIVVQLQHKMHDIMHGE